jgi:hypothetical protein
MSVPYPFRFIQIVNFSWMKSTVVINDILTKNIHDHYKNL